MYWQFLIVVSFLVITLTGCTSQNSFKIENLAKSDIDKISELHLKEVTQHLRTLTRKLYIRNPAELKKNPGATINSRINMIFQCSAAGGYREIEYKTGTEAILLGFDKEYRGDRVFSMMYGLYTMILNSYNNKCDLFIFDYLSEQNLYSSARNIEIFVWRLKTRVKDNGELLLLTDSLEGLVPDLSYERLFGKMISLQDTMARIISGRTGRLIEEVVQTAGMAFLPLPI